MWRLARPGADGRARDFFQRLYAFFVTDYTGGSDTTIGHDSRIITPDHPVTDLRKHHRDHIHAEIP